MTPEVPDDNQITLLGVIIASLLQSYKKKRISTITQTATVNDIIVPKF